MDLAVRADCPRLMAGNDYQSHRTPRPGPAHRLADSQGLDSGPDGLAGDQHGGDGRDLPALHALGRADPLPGAAGQPVPGFAQRRGRAGRTAAQPPALAAHPPAKTGNTCARQRSAPPPSNRRPAPNGCGCTCRPSRAPWPSRSTGAPCSGCTRGRCRARPRPSRAANRSGAARVGRYHPPSPALVPSLLDEQFQFISRPQCDNPVIAAAWAHSRFESIHPGAVGAGRTGPPYRCATASGSAV